MVTDVAHSADLAGDRPAQACLQVVACPGVALHLELAAGGPEVDVLAAFGAEALKRAFIDPVALEVEEADQSLEIL
jgi:hypothetical protein